MDPIVFHALFSLVQGMNIGYRPYAFGPVGGTGHVGSRVLKGVMLHGCFRPVPRFRHGKPTNGRFSVNTSILTPLDIRLPFPPMRMCRNGPPNTRRSHGLASTQGARGLASPWHGKQRLFPGPRTLAGGTARRGGQRGLTPTAPAAVITGSGCAQ